VNCMNGSCNVIAVLLSHGPMGDTTWSTILQFSSILEILVFNWKTWHKGLTTGYGSRLAPPRVVVLASITSRGV
jgi:hypothetical protein